MAYAIVQPDNDARVFGVGPTPAFAWADSENYSDSPEGLICIPATPEVLNLPKRFTYEGRTFTNLFVIKDEMDVYGQEIDEDGDVSDETELVCLFTEVNAEPLEWTEFVIVREKGKPMFCDLKVDFSELAETAKTHFSDHQYFVEVDVRDEFLHVEVSEIEAEAGSEPKYTATIRKQFFSHKTHRFEPDRYRVERNGKHFAFAGIYDVADEFIKALTDY